ncbi:MAG: xylulokinase [Terracidiphilus sp.]|jgi:xylulokinase
MNRYTIGIDVGTGGTRALMVDEKGALLGSATHEHVPFASPQNGWAEQDPRDWWNAGQKAIGKLLRETGVSKNEIVAVGLAGQMHGAVLLDEKEEVLRPALIWCDQRTAEECRVLNETIGEQRLVELTSNPALPNFTLTKLMWVRTHEPEIWKKFRSFLLPKDYVRLQLTGVRAIDVSDASGTLLLDVVHRRWSKEMVKATGLDERCLPEVFESPEIVGKITARAAQATGLAEGTPVVAGAGDQAGGAIGMGIVKAGCVSATIGTSGVVFAATDQPFLDPKGRLHTFCHAIPNRWHVMGVTQAAGLSLRWFRDTFGTTGKTAGDPYDSLSQEAAAIPAGADGVLWAPYLMGERTPHLDSDVRGALIGLAASHGRGHIIRAILEGVAFSLKDSLTIFAEIGVPVNDIRLGGGGARSPLWRQIQADVYAKPVSLLAAEEGCAYGSAVLAGVGAGIWPSVDEACAQIVRIASVVNPAKQSSDKLQQQYKLYRAIYPALKQIK